MRRLLWGLMLLGCWPLARAEVNVWPKEERRDFEVDPPGMECDVLETRGHPETPAGEISELPKGGLLAELLCPECLRDPRYQADVPLRRIQRYLVPPPSDIWGEFDCAEECPHWLLRQGEDAIMIVHVGAQILCGVTGNCPGRAYERTGGRWSLIAEFNSNAGIELCATRRRGGMVELWMTSFDDYPMTWVIRWKPDSSAQPKQQ